MIGALADSVYEVKEITPDQVEAPPKIGMRWKSEFIKGIGKHDDQFIIILDIDRVFSTEDLIVAEVNSMEAEPVEDQTD